jgi:lysophospholipase L1-like esterase
MAKATTPSGSAKRRSRQDAQVAAAIARGRAQAAVVDSFRKSQRARRARAAAAAASRPARRGARPLPIPPAVRRAMGPAASAGIVIAEGDSWFDYPFNDVLRLLEDDYAYDVESVARKGDRVEDMAYTGGQFEEFARRLEKLIRENKVPTAILLSGGGNDIAGDEFAILLNHAASGLPPLNDDIVRGVIDVRLRNAYAFLIGGLTELSTRLLGRPIPIVTHGYDYPIPDGRGFLGGFFVLPGPWLEPGFRRKGFGNIGANKTVMRDLIDRFNSMLKAVSNAPELTHVRYLDLRGTLKGDATYKRDWANELHPTARGFSAVAAKFASTIHALP